MKILWPHLFPPLGVLVAVIYITREKKIADTPRKLEIILMGQIVCGLGLYLLWGGIGHLLLSDSVAESIGWATGSPFHSEVDVWDASSGIVGILCLNFREYFWLGTIIGG
ncbi:MAG: DUF6790 family protein [Methanomicrobiales archaeon]